MDKAYAKLVAARKAASKAASKNRSCMDSKPAASKPAAQSSPLSASARKRLAKAMYEAGKRDYTQYGDIGTR